MTKLSNILFVHGAWANSSAWDKVLPLIEAAGLTGTSVSLSLTSLADDVATVKRAIALIEGPLLLVGHSYGGAVITEAGNDPKVAGLVYVAAFAPEAGESAASLGAGAPPTRLLEVVRPDAHEFFKLTREGVDEVFAQDLTPAERSTIFATQNPLAGAALGGAVTSPAWKQKPSWYLLATADRTIHPELQKTMAARADATTISIDASHVAMLSQPRAVADLILQAAG
ncbi:alpha/beta fold hydrolase [uncultured Caballeronia sp.]|jgi:pimeloyl-ACP methyl ester carboxylesterase|uniref:alpha/beta hydrolase n=1 Tax=uncultured Caballeronia sp. TaxID=1827198 RepID=UPI001575FAA3